MYVSYMVWQQIDVKWTLFWINVGLNLKKVSTKSEKICFTLQQARAASGRVECTECVMRKGVILAMGGKDKWATVYYWHYDGDVRRLSKDNKLQDNIRPMSVQLVRMYVCSTLLLPVRKDNWVSTSDVLC